VVEGGEELSDIKGKNAHVALSEPSHPDKMSKVCLCLLWIVGEYPQTDESQGSH